MKAEKAVHELLAANTGVANLVAARIYPAQLPIGVQYPAISIELINAQRTTGPLLALQDPGVCDARIQVTAWSPQYGEAKAVADAARIALQRYKGTTTSGIAVWDIVTTSAGPDLYDSDLKLYGEPADYTVTHPE